MTGVTIAGWGFRYPDHSQKIGVVIPDKGSNVQKIQILITDEGNPAANREFKYGLVSNPTSKMGITDKEGKCAIGNFPIGLEFYVFDIKTATNFPFIVIKGQEIYTCDATVETPVVVPPQPIIEPEKREVAPKLKIVNHTGTAVSSRQIYIEYAAVKTLYISNEEGIIQLSEMKEGEDFVVTDASNKDIRQCYTIDTITNPYIFRLPPEIPHYEPASLKVVNLDGQGVGNYKIFLTYDGNRTILTSDSNGIVHIPEIHGNTFDVTDGDGFQNLKHYELEPNKKLYIYPILASMPKVKVLPELKVVDMTEKPVPNFPVYINYADKKIRVFSDKEGNIHLPEMMVDDKFAVSDGFSDANRQDFTAEADKNVYFYYLDYSLKSGNKDITIRIIDEKEKPVCKDYAVLMSEDRIVRCLLDEKGCIYLDNNDFERNKPIKFILVQDGKEISGEDFKLVPAEQEYTVQIDTTPCQWWKRLLEVIAAIGVIPVILFILGIILDICQEIG